MKITNIKTIGELQDALKFLENTGMWHPDTPLRIVQYTPKLQADGIEELEVTEKYVRIELS
jgi:hypothetical protein